MINIVVDKDQNLDIKEDTTILVTKNIKLLLKIKDSVKVITNIEANLNLTRIIMIENKNIDLKDDLNLAQGASLKNYALSQGNCATTIEVTGNLSKNNSFIKHYFVDLASGLAKKNWLINATNTGKNTIYDITHYTLAYDEAKVSVVCKAEMKKGCNSSSNEQLLKAIMLSDKADVRIDPLLIIDEPDLESAGHGATIGKIDEEQLYYLRSRGIDEVDAKLLIISGFFMPIINEINDNTLKNEIFSQIKKQIQ